MESRKRGAAVQPAGGYKQKLARHVEAPKPSAVYSILMEKWAWGAISQPLMQEIARAAIADGIDNEDLKSLAVPHLTRLQDKLPVTPLSHASSYMPCVSKTVAGKLVEASLAMLLPHQMFAALWQFSKNIFIDKLCGGTPDNIPNFGQRCRITQLTATHTLSKYDQTTPPSASRYRCTATVSHQSASAKVGRKALMHFLGVQF